MKNKQQSEVSSFRNVPADADHVYLSWLKNHYPFWNNDIVKTFPDMTPFATGHM